MSTPATPLWALAQVLTRALAPLREAVRTVAASENLSARGAYELKAANGEARVTLFATGTEVPLALKAAETLEGDG